MEATCFTALTACPKASAVALMVILPRMPAIESSNPVAPHNQITRMMADNNPCMPIQELAAIPALKIPPATIGNKAIRMTAFNHNERSQRACGRTLATAMGGASTAKTNSTALAEAKANNIPPIANNEPMDRLMEIKPPRNVRLAIPSTTEVAVVEPTKSIASEPVSPITLPTIHHPSRMIRSRKGPDTTASAPAVTQSPTTRRPLSSSPSKRPNDTEPIAKGKMPALMLPTSAGWIGRL